MVLSFAPHEIWVGFGKATTYVHRKHRPWPVVPLETFARIECHRDHQCQHESPSLDGRQDALSSYIYKSPQYTE